jgi:hypothetical protein
VWHGQETMPQRVDFALVILFFLCDLCVSVVKNLAQFSSY